MWCHTWQSHKSQYITEAWHLSQSQVTQSYNIKKNIKGSEISDTIQYNNNILVLWKACAL